MEKKLKDGLEKLKLTLSSKKQAQLISYINLLDKWNKKQNLTAIRNPLEMVTKHLLDSLSILNFLKEEIKEGNEVLDVGSGGGLPGIPLAIALPNIDFTLVESNSKKTTFLQQVKIELGLKNIIIKNKRVEELKDKKFKVIISRAFSSLDKTLHMTKHLLEQKGVFLAMKGKQIEDELRALPKEYKVFSLVTINIPEYEGTRHLIKIVKQEG